MKINKLSIILIVLFNTIKGFSQTNTSINVDSSMVKSKVDFCGYNASNFSNPNSRIANNGTLSPLAMDKNLYPANAIFNCGAFRLYYEDIALATGDGFDDPADGANRRATLCAVYQYVQNTFNFSNISAADPITIEIQRSFTALNPSANPSVLAAAFPVFPNSTVPGIYNGSLLNHVLSNASPNINLFDAVLQVNFAPVHPATLGQLTYYTLSTLPVPNCNFDLYTVLLHEVGHQLGFASLLREDGANRPMAGFGNNQYSLYDWQNIWHGNINTPSSFEKIVTGTTSNPQINPLIVNSANYLRDGGLWLNNNGRFLGNLPIYSGVYGTANLLTVGSIVSHICGDGLSFTERFSLSPGYRKPFSMSPFMDFGESRRVFTDEELRIFLNLGYTLNPIFAASTSINGTNSNSNIILNNRAPVTTKQVTSPAWVSGTGTLLTFPDLVQNVDFPITNNGVPLIIQLASDPTISDADGDIVRIENNTLFNIRGCSNNGNNHNCLSVNAAGTIITYTPRPNFIGRAQFGFYLHDGNERGSFMIYTIDVNPGSSLVNTPNVNTPIGNNELIVNGDFEEATETKTTINEFLPNTSMQLGREEGLFFGGVQFADAHPLQYVNWPWTNTGGIIMANTYKHCSQGVTPIRFGAIPFSVPSSAYWNNPISVTGNNYSYILGDHNYHTLASPLIACNRYITTFDVNFLNTGLAAGSIYTFTLNVHSAIAYPTNPSIQSIPVSIVVGTGWQTVTVPFVYCSTTPGNFLNFVGGGKINYDNVSLIKDLSPVPPLIINASANSPQICIGNSSTLTGIATNNFCNTTYIWQPGNLNGTSVAVSPIATTIYTLTVNDGCRAATTSVNVVVNPLPTVTAVASPTSVCTLSPNSTLTASGGVSYVWNTGATTNAITVSPTNTTVYSVIGTNTNGCSNTASVALIYSTCSVCTSCTSFGTSGLITSNPSSSGVYCINNDVTIVGTKIFSSSEFKIAPTVKIIIPNGANLIITNSHLYACGNMWQGIVIQNGGKLSVLNNSMIEDAIIAVDINNNTQTTNVLTITSSTFNKNKTGVNINNYTQSIANYPFNITNSIFTCRNILPIAGATPYPVANIGGANPGSPLGNIVINNSTYSQTGLSATLKNPFAGTKSTVGLMLTDVGVTLNAETTSPTYYEFSLGNILTNNIFDNQITCVDLLNSNFTSKNNIYQNTITTGHGGSGGIGINAKSSSTSNNRLQVTSVLLTVGANKFVNCSRAINSINYFEHKITYNDFRSTQANATAILSNHVGSYGVYINTNRYRVCNVSDNSLYNIENGLTLAANFGPLNINGIPAYATQYCGLVNFDRNTIQPNLTGSPVTTQYVANAIQLQNILASGLYFANNNTPIIQASNNNLTSVFRGVKYSNWKKENMICNSNTVSLINDIYHTTILQYGISSDNCGPYTILGNSVRGNNVTGYGLANPNAKGIVQALNDNTIVNCNTTNNVTNGIEFSGYNHSTSFSNNQMSNSKYGFVLSNTGDIGQQGNATTPQDNRWTGNWTGGKFKTATLSGSTSQSSLLYIRTNATSPFNPNGSTFTNLGFGIDDYNIGGVAPSLIPTSSNPPYTTCPVIINTGGGPTPAIMALRTKLEQIVLDLINYQVNAAQSKIINKNQVYRLLNADPTLMTSSPVLQTFYTNSQATTRKTFDDVETNISNGNVTTATNMNAAVSPINAIENNYKNFYNLAIKNSEGNLNASDSVIIANIAFGCPFTDGVMVYQARALLNSLYLMYREYPDNCNAEQGSRLAKNKDAETPDEIKTGFDVVLFPNPGANNFSMATFGLTDGNIDMSISDVTGKIVFTNKLTVVNALTLFNLDVKNGIYFVKIINNDKTITKKLIIQQ